MADSIGAGRYARCPVCGSRYPVPSTLTDQTARLQALDTEAPALWDRGVIFCGNCGAGFRPNVGHDLESAQSDALCDVRYVGPRTNDGEPGWSSDAAPTDVPREASRRWLRFRPDSHPTQAGEFVFIEVMTSIPSGRAPRELKLCDVIVTREDLLRALETVKPRPRS